MGDLWETADRPGAGAPLLDLIEEDGTKTTTEQTTRIARIMTLEWAMNLVYEKNLFYEKHVGRPLTGPELATGAGPL